MQPQASLYSVSILDSNLAVSGAGSKATARIRCSIGFVEVGWTPDEQRS